MKKNISNTLVLGFGLAFMLFWASCSSTSSPCSKLNCQNGSTCLDDVCNCLEGYSGNECATQKTPTKVKISKIEVLDFKATDTNGAGWDLTSGPDIFVAISTPAPASASVWTATTFFSDAVPSGNSSWTLTPALELNATTPYVFSLSDYDSPDPSDFMGGFQTAPFEAGKGFPTTWTWTSSDASLKLRLTVSYVF